MALRHNETLLRNEYECTRKGINASAQLKYYLRNIKIAFFDGKKSEKIGLGCRHGGFLAIYIAIKFKDLSFCVFKGRNSQHLQALHTEKVIVVRSSTGLYNTLIVFIVNYLL